MAGPVYVDGVGEWSATTGTDRPYVLGGAILGGRTLNGSIADGDWAYFRIEDGPRWEIITARFDAPASLVPLDYFATSANNAAVVWPASGRRIIRMIPTFAVGTGVAAANDELFWLGIATGLPGDLGLYSDGVAEVVDCGSIEVGTINSDLGLLSEIGVAPENDEVFWLGVTTGLLGDLGLYSDGVTEVVDCGSIEVGMINSDLGLLSEIVAPAVPDDAIFWMVLEIGVSIDLGTVSDNPTVIEAGELHDGSLSLIDIGVGVI